MTNINARIMTFCGRAALVYARVCVKMKKVASEKVHGSCNEAEETMALKTKFSQHATVSTPTQICRLIKQQQ